jgi:hypothetical protein
VAIPAIALDPALEPTLTASEAPTAVTVALPAAVPWGLPIPAAVLPPDTAPTATTSERPIPRTVASPDEDPTVVLVELTSGGRLRSCGNPTA